MIAREPLKRDPNAGRKPERAVLRNLGAGCSRLPAIAILPPALERRIVGLRELVSGESRIKIGAKVVSHGRYVTFQVAEVAVPRPMFKEILRLIARLRAAPAPARRALGSDATDNDDRSVRVDRGKPAGNPLLRLARGTRRGRSLLPWAAKNQTMARAGSATPEKLFPNCELPHTCRPIPKRRCRAWADRPSI
jgi:hypothetical protein